MKFAPAVKRADFDAWNHFDAQFLAGRHGLRNPARDVVIRDRQRRDAGIRDHLDIAERAAGIQQGLMRDLERYIVLQVVDTRWREHLENMDYMREGIHLRGMAQKDPLVEYRNEGHILFGELNESIRAEVISLLFHMPVEVVPADEDGMAALPPSK